MRRRRARLAIFPDHALEVVDGVQIDVVQLGDLGFDVARHGDVHHEHRPVLARLERALDRALAENG